MSLPKKIKVGHIVRYLNPRAFFHGKKANRRKNKITGLVLEVKGAQWVKVQWTDGVIFDEHQEDLEIVNGSSDGII
jgi:hypothetical protein